MMNVLNESFGIDHVGIKQMNLDLSALIVTQEFGISKA